MKIKKIIIIIFIVVVITFCVPHTFAILRDVISGSGGMSAATWSVTLNQTDVNDHVSITPDPNGMTASYTVNIATVSQVNVVYYIEVSNLPSGVSVSLDGGNYEPSVNNKIIFSNFTPIAYNDSNKNRTHTLSFKASSGAGYVTDDEIDIDVVARQQI